MSEETGSRATAPIYEYIKMNTKDGRLPEGFEIPWLKDMWAPGAHDGVLLNHMVPPEPDPEREKKILEGLKLMAAEDNGDHIDEVFSVFEELDRGPGIVRLFDEIGKTLFIHQQELDLDKLLQFSDWLLCKGISLLAVKLGLTVLSGFAAPFVEEVMMEMGVYDEFTYYAARTLSRESWPKGNEELFALAKNVNGWGRIHSVEWLRPETQEIRDWLLFEGSDNTVIPQYSSDICLQKAAAEQLLDGDLTAEKFGAVGKLIRQSLERGPCTGVTNGDRLLPKYIAKAKDYPADRDTIRMILDAAEAYRLSRETIDASKLLLK